MSRTVRLELGSRYFREGVAESALIPVDTEGRASGVRLANDGTVKCGVQLC